MSRRFSGMYPESMKKKIPVWRASERNIWYPHIWLYLALKKWKASLFLWNSSFKSVEALLVLASKVAFQMSFTETQCHSLVIIPGVVKSIDFIDINWFNSPINIEIDRNRSQKKSFIDYYRLTKSIVIDNKQWSWSEHSQNLASNTHEVIFDDSSNYFRRSLYKVPFFCFFPCLVCFNPGLIDLYM